MGEKIYIQDIIDSLAEKQDIGKDAAIVFVRTIFDLIEEALEIDKYIKIKGLGTFKLTEVDSRESMNINTGDRIKIEGHSKISFIPDTSIRDLINKPFSHFETVILNEGITFDDTQESNEDGEVDEEVNSDMPNKDIPQKTDKIPESILTVEPEKPTVETLPTDNSSETNEEYLAKESTSEPTNHHLPVTNQDKASEDTTEQPENIEKQSASTEAINSISDKEEGPKNKEIKSTLPYFVGIACATVLLGVGIVLFICKPNIWYEIVSPVELAKDTVTTIHTPEISSQKAKEQLVIDVEEIKPVIDTTNTVITGIRKGLDSVKADSTSYIIVGTMTIYKIASGETLTMVSKRFYETKDLWPYLVIHNRNIIKNPNRVSSGTTIRIPALRDK